MKQQQDELTSTLELLKEKGWLTYDEEQDAFKMHRIIQEAMKAHLQPAYADLEKLVNGIAQLLYKDESKDNPIDKFQYVVYAERDFTIIYSSGRRIFFDISIEFGNGVSGFGAL